MFLPCKIFNQVYDFIFMNLYLQIISAIGKPENLDVTFIFMFL